jgi:hypothetical protein
MKTMTSREDLNAAADRMIDLIERATQAMKDGTPKQADVLMRQAHAIAKTLEALAPERSRGTK